VSGSYPAGPGRNLMCLEQLCKMLPVAIDGAWR